MPDMGNTFAENDATVLLTENQPMNGGFADNGAAQPMQQGFGGANGFENYAPVQNNMQNNMQRNDQPYNPYLDKGPVKTDNPYMQGNPYAGFGINQNPAQNNAG